MPSIDSLGYSLVYITEIDADNPPGLSQNGIALRTEARALEGMQKEALVYYGPSGVVWRLVSDEGPYLNGTDLAPFPLAFYTTGMALSFVEELLKHADEAGIEIKDYRLTQDNYYTMEGSAIRGDMLGGALPVEINIEIDSDASKDDAQNLINLAKQTSPAQVYMEEKLSNTFALCCNGDQVLVSDVNPSPKNNLFIEPSAKMDAAEPLDQATYMKDIITKLESADTVFNVDGGVGSSLKDSQRRTLHVRGLVTPRPDGLKEVKIQLFKPLGSTFRFLSDTSTSDGGAERAPSSLVYLAAGVGFCFMTQIGRYTNIMKHDISAYSIVQDTVFEIASDHAKAESVDTHVFLDTGEPDGNSQKTLYMSERTCFLHAAMRMSNQSKISMTYL